MKKLLEMVNSLKVPKSQWNSFGKYSFRNNEDIQTALKPKLLEYGFDYEATTEWQDIAGEILCIVRVKITDPESKKSLSGIGGAVIDLNKKGMTKEQASGSALSFASKYAHGQALMLDDTKDGDNNDNRNHQSQQGQPQQKYKMSELKKRIANGTMSSEKANVLFKQGLVIDDTK